MTDEGSNGAEAIVGVDIECLERVKSGKAQCEHMFSALPPTTDIHQARTPCLKSAGAMNGWNATTK
jgi:hypothetical protein